MIKFVSDILGSEIILFQEHARLGSVKGIIFSIEGPEILGIYCQDPIEKKVRVIQPTEIKSASNGLILANGYDSLIDARDVIRLRDSARIGAKIIGQKVCTESGQHLGKVNNATINTRHWILDKLYVTPILGVNFISKDLIITARKIVRIEKKNIVVSDEYAKVKNRKALSLATPISE